MIQKENHKTHNKALLQKVSENKLNFKKFPAKFQILELLNREHEICLIYKRKRRVN